MQLNFGRFKIKPNNLAASVCFFIPLLLSACGSGSGGDKTGITTANTSIGGTISGLVNPLVLQNNGGDNLTLTADGSFAFATKLAITNPYAVTVLTQPASQTCTVSKSTGTVSSHDNITDVLVACSAVDLNAPHVIATTPASGSTGIALNNLITARFSEIINPATLTGTSFIVSSGVVSASGIQGTISLSIDNRSAIFIPNSALTPNTQYSAMLTTAVQDITRNNLASNFIWSFTTGAALDNTAPYVTSNSPITSATAVPTNSVISASFSEAINPATLTATTVSVNGVSGIVVASADNLSVTFTPNTPLSASTNYTAILSVGIKDTAGNALANNTNWNFTTGNTADTASPILLTVTPAANASLQQVSTISISATFNKPINCATVSTDNFQVLEAGVAVPGTTECNGATLLFKPHPGTSLPTNTTLNASLSATIKDVAGNAISAYTWSFGMAPWTRQLGTTISDYASAITSDSNGNVYAAGVTGNVLGDQYSGGVDFFIIKYNASGVKQWIRQMGTTFDDYATAITCDSNGNIFVAGYTNGALDGQLSAGGNDLFIVKYDSNGVKLWTRQLGTTTVPANESASAITSDSNGNVYVAGYTLGALGDGQTNAGDADLFISKYNSSGTKQWTRQLGTVTIAANTTADYAQAITSDSTGNVYVAGVTNGALDGQTYLGGSDLFIVKYDTNGTKLWTRQLGTAADDKAHAITSDSNGNIYVAGYTNGALDGQTYLGGSDLFIVKYDTNGTKQWTRQLGTTNYEVANAITHDSNGNVYVAGYTDGALDNQTNAGTGSIDLFITKYDPSGVKQWTRQMGSVAHDSALAITSDSNSNVYAAGYTQGALDGQTFMGINDLFIVKYQSDGRKR